MPEDLLTPIETIAETIPQIPAEFLGDPAPFDVDTYFNDWAKEKPIAESAQHRDNFTGVLHSLSRPFLAQGYTAAAALNRGIAAFSSHLDSVTDYVALSTGTSKGGIFEEAAKIYEQNADYWKKRAEEVGAGFIDEIVGEAAGGFVPGIANFAMDVASGLTFPYMDGAAKAYERGEDPFSAGIVQAAKTGVLAGLFRMMAPLKQYLRAPTMGTVFGLQEMEGAEEGQKTKAFVKGAAIGAGYSLTSPGGRMGLNEVRENTMAAIKDLGEVGGYLPREARTIMGGIRSLQPIGQERALVSISELRDKAGMEPEAFDKALLDLAKEGKVALHQHDFASSLTEAERSKLLAVKDPNAYPSGVAYYVGVVPKAGFLGEQGGADFQKKPRKFLQTMEEAAETEPEAVEKLKKIEPKTYIVQPNAESMAKAQERIDTEGLSATVDYALSDSTLNAEKGAAFITLMKRFQKEGDFDREVEMIEAYDQQLREAGRFVQAASIWSKGTPQAFIRWANKQLDAVRDKYGWSDTLFNRKPESFTLSKDEQKIILEKFKEINQLPEGIDRTDKTLELIDMVAKKVPPSTSELLDAYRYQNMLSSPKTQMRNIGENLVNTFISRPIDITTRGGIDYFKSLLTGKDRQAYVNDAPVYMKTAINSVPNAVHAFMETLKLARGVDVGKPELGLEMKGEFQRARMKQMPTALTLVQRFMEATDKFNMALIGAGEMAVLKKRGVPDADAYAQAMKVAEESLYRGKLEPGDPRLSYPSKVLASLGKMLEGSRKLPGIGTLSKWYVPFLKTPINKGIQMVERSPLGAITDPRGIDQQKAAMLMSGAVVTALGAIWAAEGQTTWAPPTDQKEKELFYASGRKPFSVRMGDKWIPIWYLGPFALAFGLPMAVKHYTQDRKQAITQDGLEKLAEIAEGTAQFIGSQSSTQSIGALFSALGGDIDYKFSSQTGFTAQQVIPGASLVRYINTIIDPVYRHPQGFIEGIEANLPGLSQRLDARMTPLFDESRRETINYFLPYDIGTSKEVEEILMPLARKEARDRYLESKIEQITKKLRSKEITHADAMIEIQKLMDAPIKSVEMLGEELSK